MNELFVSAWGYRYMESQVPLIIVAEAQDILRFS